MKEQDVIEELKRDPSKVFITKRDSNIKLEVIDGQINLSKLAYTFPDEEWEEVNQYSEVE
ncbi:hypothetical protein [Tissierella sp.]|uniref:hypothetical protein n=1 Tax=Tissierella sp. TaxID=41274 RepID=UPI00285A01C8|nr:hypothetical protein [Tissierella sp.]MDR7856050.1 hypothetical protein [Tissierella sp.]